MSLPLRGHTALVTGAAVRIGAAIAWRLAQAGCDVVIHHRESRTEAEALAARIRGAGAQAFTLAADLADPEQVAKVMPQARAAAGRPLSFLVNNASTFPKDRFEAIDQAQAAQTMQVNAWAPFQLMRDLASQTRRGSVVNILDTRLSDPDPERASYHLSKGLLRDMTIAAAKALAPNIAVNAVLPGPVLAQVDAPEETASPTGKNLPLRRAPDPDDVADAVLFLLAARTVTGVLVPVDGGRHLGTVSTDSR